VHYFLKLAIQLVGRARHVEVSRVHEVIVSSLCLVVCQLASGTRVQLSVGRMELLKDAVFLHVVKRIHRRVNRGVIVRLLLHHCVR